MITKTAIGLLAGLLLGVAAAAGGFVGFLVTVVLGLLGIVVGALLDGRRDLSDLFRDLRP